MTDAARRYTVLERAFMLAADGSCSSTGEIKAQLKKEGFSTQQIMGPALLRQIRGLCMSAQKNKT